MLYINVCLIVAIIILIIPEYNAIKICAHEDIHPEVLTIWTVSLDKLQRNERLVKENGQREWSAWPPFVVPYCTFLHVVDSQVVAPM